MSKPSIFIGSSTQGIQIARNISEHLCDVSDCTIWNEGPFGLSEGTLEAITKIESDFAILVLTPDDLLEKKGVMNQAPRDNVIFECGFFMGKLGRERTFLVYDTFNKIELPSDLAGITIATYSSNRDDRNLYAAIGIACNKIRREIEKQGKIKLAKAQTTYEKNILERGSLSYSDLLIDGTMVILDDNSVLNKDLKKAIFSNEIIPMKYLYCTDEGCEYWLEICNKPEYTFYTNSELLLQKNSNELSNLLNLDAGTAEFDLISLGVGDGKKDTILLRKLLNQLKGDEILYYYPIEISAPMLIKSVKYSLSNLPKKNLRTKAILGDFNLVDKYQPIYQERDNPNIFSLLGNSIGNSDEPLLIESLTKSLKSGDYLIVEANTTISTLKEFCDDEINKRHDFSPLQSLGVKYEPEKLDYQIIDNQSQVKNTMSVLGIYESVQIDNKIIDNVKLSIVHHYDKNSFIKHFQDNCQLICLKTWTHNNATLFLFKK